MKSLKNHLSLVIALLSILFSLQTFVVVDRAIQAYKENLASNYSLVVVSKKMLNEKILVAKNPLLSEVQILSPDTVIERLNSGIDKKNIELLKLSLPKFYKLKLNHYPSPQEIKQLTQELLINSSIIKVETFSKTHDTTYKLLVLFKTVITLFAVSVAIVTTLLIAKELKIWQFNHNERMNIMALFGAPTWLRSAVLFRLSIVDAIVASLLAFILFSYISANEWVVGELRNIDIEIVIFDPLLDFGVMLAVAIILSTSLASFIVVQHKEEV